MPTVSDHRTRELASASSGMILPVLVILGLLVVIVPISPVVLDLLLAANLTTSVILLLATLFIVRPLDFNAFPSMLLLTTLARLVLNIASTRLVLTRAADHGASAAGEVIHTFAQFVAQDQVAVGFVIFAILVVIQYVVVTQGAMRLSEVAARFALDGMPGRQMAVDADLNAGAITVDEAQRRRAEIAAQADFHAAMDGAGKFVRGDAIAGILITIVNLVGGIAIGVIQFRMPLAQALEVFPLLTIGDGLVAQIPSFLIGLSAALLATRTSTGGSLSRDVIRQTLHEPAVLFLASATTLAFTFTGLPTIPLLILSAGCAVAGERLRRRQVDVRRVQTSAAPATLERQPLPKPRPEDQLAIEAIELELGIRLIRLANSEAGNQLIEGIQKLRNRIAQELGILLPKVKIRDNLRLGERGYQIKLRGVLIASGEIYPDRLLATETALVNQDLEGIKIVDPASGRPARWIAPESSEDALEAGYQVAEPHRVLIEHLAEIVRSHAHELLTRQQVHHLLENLRKTSPQVIDELIPGLLKPSQVHQILANLLRERVSIRDLEIILESLGAHAERTRDPDELTEQVRQALGRALSQSFRDSNGAIRAITLDPALEDILITRDSAGHSTPGLTPQIADGICRELARCAKRVLLDNGKPVIVCGSRSRRVLRRIIEASIPRLAVLGVNEIPRDATVRSVFQIPLQAVTARGQTNESRTGNQQSRRISDLAAAAVS